MSANPLVGLKGFREECYSSWQLALPENLTELEQKTLSSATRRQIRRRTRQLEEAGDLSYVMPDTDAERKALFAVLREQRQSRFAALGRNNVLASPAHSQFYDLILQSGFDPEVLTVHGLKVGDETIATAFGLYWQKRFYLLMSTMASGNWLELSPGIVMIWKLIAHMHAKGCRTFDFTIGDEPYKRQLGATECTLSEYFRARSPIGGPYALGLWLWPSLVAIKRKFAKQQRGARQIVPKSPPTQRVRRERRVVVTATGIEKLSKRANWHSLRQGCLRRWHIWLAGALRENHDVVLTGIGLRHAISYRHYPAAVARADALSTERCECASDICDGDYVSDPAVDEKIATGQFDLTIDLSSGMSAAPPGIAGHRSTL